MCTNLFLLNYPSIVERQYGYLAIHHFIFVIFTAFFFKKCSSHSRFCDLFHIARSYNRFKECLQTVKMRDAVALALINSAMGILPVWEMYRFIQLNFPYFVQRSYDYKCILRKALHCSKYFNKVALPEAGRRAGAWKLTDNMEDLAVAFNEVLQIAKCERSCYTLSEITGH